MKYTPPLGSLEADAPYVDGNPTAGIRGSVVPAAPFNQLQRELVHIITQAGLEPSADDLTQVLAALKKLFAAPSAILPPDGVTIIEKTIENGKKVLAAASAGTLDMLEAWRKSMIGAPVMLPSPVLPDGYMWPDGTLASFEDWPELEEAYEAGKFEGYVLPASATDEDKAAWPGKWVLLANGAGLYTPRLIGLFARYCSAGGAGMHNAAGLPNIIGVLASGQNQGGAPAAVSADGGVGNAFVNGGATSHKKSTINTTTTILNSFTISFSANHSSAIYGASATVMPPSFETPVAVYLGRLA